MGKKDEDITSFYDYHQSSLAVFLDLCRHPISTSHRHSKLCMQRLGKDRILKVLYLLGPYEEDVISILGRFSQKAFKSLRPWDVLQAFHDRGNAASARWYAQLKLSSWTDTQLMGLVEEFGYLDPTHLLKCGLYIQALQHALKIGDEKLAVESSVKALGSYELAETHICRVISLWQEHKPPMTDMLQLPSSWITLFASDPILLRIDKEMALLRAFGPSVAAYARLRGGMPMDESSLKRIVQFHHQLRECLGNSLTPSTQNNSKVATAEQVQTVSTRNANSDDNTTDEIGEGATNKSTSKKVSKGKRQNRKRKGKKKKKK